jgi:hypothetical protein
MRRNVEKIGATYIWDGVSGEAVVDFLTDYITHETAIKVQSWVLKKYIQARMADNELIEWTIALISIEDNIQNGSPFYIADLPVGFVQRSGIDDQSESKYRIRRLVSPRDEYLDLSEEERTWALEETRKRWEEQPDKTHVKEIPDIPSGQIIRRIRPAKRGLLLLYVLKYDSAPPSVPHVPIVGFAISFPKSKRGEEAAIEYVVNNIFWQQEFGGEG